MASRTWDPYLLEFQAGEQLESTPVLHSFGRGHLRELAGQVLLPRVALESVLQEEPDTLGHDGRSRGGATRCMGGVPSEPISMKASGRARALRMRAERSSLQHRRPGRVQRPGVHLTGQLSQKASRRQSSLATVGPSVIHSVPDVDTHQYTKSSNKETKHPDVAGPPPDPLPIPQPVQQSHFVPEKCFEDLPLPCPASACLTSNSASECSLELASYSSPSQEESETTDIDTDADGAQSSSEPSPATALHLDWTVDENTLCFQNLPLSITAKELEEEVEEFGKVTHCTVLQQCNKAGLSTALVRMEEKSACEWVLSCFHGNSYGDSPLQLACYFACYGVG